MEEIKVRKRKDTFKEIDKLAPDPKKYWSVDFLKVWMMLLVILDHSVPHDILGWFYSVFWQRIAIPVFMVVLGFNWAKSLSRKKDQSLGSLYSWNDYWKPKIKRFVVPYAIIFGLSIIFYGVMFLVSGPDFLYNIYSPGVPPDSPLALPSLHNPWLKLALILPIWGPGNWFVPLIFLLIIIFPLLYKFFTLTRWFSWIALPIFYVAEMAFQYSGRYVVNTFGFDWYMNFFTFIPLQLLTAIGLGMWLSIDHRWDVARNAVIWVLGIASLVFIIYSVSTGGYPRFAIMFAVYDYNLFIYPYSALLVMLILNIIPKSPQGQNFRNFSFVSRATYHILMTQIFYFSVVYSLLLNFNAPFGFEWRADGLGGVYWVFTNLPRFLWFYPLNVLITFGIGIGWYALDKRVSGGKHVAKKKMSQKQIDMMKAKGWIK